MFYLIYGDDHDTKVKDALEQFNAKIRSMGVELKAAEIVDL